MKDWLLVSGYNSKVEKKIGRIFRKMGCLLYLPIGIIYLVLALIFIPLGIVDLLFFVEIRWVRGVFGKGKDMYTHTIFSVTILVLMFLSLGAVYFYTTHVLDLFYLDRRINLAAAAIIWFILSAAIIQIIVRRTSRQRKIRLLDSADHRFKARIAKIDDQLSNISSITGYDPDYLKVIDANVNALSNERKVLLNEQKNIEKTVRDISKFRIRLNLW
jgi:hypothetical protein